MRLFQDNELIDRVKTAFAIKTDAELARRAGMQKSTISKIRNGERSLPSNDQLFFLCAIGVLQLMRENTTPSSVEEYDRRLAKLAGHDQETA